MKLILTDFANQATDRLLANLDKAEIPYLHVSSHYDGFLSEDCLNPIAYYIGAEKQAEKHLYFNQIKVPDFYEIRNENGSQAEILQGDHVVGRVLYAPGRGRIVQAVHWLDRSGQLILAELYNAQAEKYADVLYNEQNKEAKRLYYRSGRLVLSYDTASRTMQRFDAATGDVVFVGSMVDFLLDYLANVLQAGGLFDEVIYNTLATAHFVAQRLDMPSTLYWQESLKDSIPGNMEPILDGKSSTGRVLFENVKAFQKVQDLRNQAGAGLNCQLAYLGAIEDFKRDNPFRPNYLTITRSDEIFFDEAVAQTGVAWTIAAPTDVSPKLRKFAAAHDNVRLIEQMKLEQIETLLSEHDIYLDLNRGSEVDNIIRRAYFEGLLTLGTTKNAKNPSYELVLVEEKEFLSLIKGQDKGRLLEILRKKKGEPASRLDWEMTLG